MALNKAMVIGHLGQKPELRYEVDPEIQTAG